MLFCGFSQRRVPARESQVCLAGCHRSDPTSALCRTVIIITFSTTIAAGAPAPGSSSHPEAGTIAVLLATLNGAHHLAEQLDSIAAQTHRRWTVWASDDASTDDTCAVLARYRGAWDAARQAPAGGTRMHLLRGPARGFVANFLSLACNPDIDADYFAFCDQDDLWDADKLTRAAAFLAACDAARPALYGARTRLVDAAGLPLGLSPRFAHPPAFANALVQSLAGGNTMVFNRSARALLMQAGAAADVITHDWWLYLLVSGCDGVVIYDLEPRTRYRQHPHNLVGSNRGLRARVERIGMLFRGQFRQAIDRHFAALLPVRARLSNSNLALLDRFAQARRLPLWQRLHAMRACGLYRQTRLGNLGLFIGICFNKI